MSADGTSMNDSDLHYLYWNQGLSLSKISLMLGIGQTTLLKRMQSQGIPRRERSEAVKIWRMDTRTSLENRFWKYVQKTERCWLWIGARNSEGYGYLRFNYAQLRAHRVSWELHFGTIPDGLFVLHRCDNPPCVNPEHLFLGTNSDNIRDAIKKGSSIGGSEKGRCSGEKNSHAKLTKVQVNEIRVRLRNYRRGLVVQLAKEFEVSKSTIMDIWKERSWKAVTF